ncbi:MAG: amino acid permease [Candidatus Aenigmarchaeota archaeon]|nr:amino acid permease [Candidatus Aenigmarchaeota archaeon]
MRKIRFVRNMGLFGSVMLGLGFIIGSGIFIMPLVAGKAAGTFSLISWVIAGIYCILAGLAFAECALKMPKAGGLYSYAHAAFGNFFGFLAGWTFWLGYTMTIATEQWAIGMYLHFFIPQLNDITRVIIAVTIGYILTYINFRGIKGASETEDVFTIGKLLPLLLFALVGLAFFNLSNLFPLLPQGTAPLTAIASGIIIVLWAYQGAEIITVPEEEIKNAKRTVPKAIIISVVTVMVLYLMISIAFLGSVHWQDYANSQSPLADVFRDLTQSKLGQIGGIIIAFGGLISIIGALNAVILAASRISFAMARDGLFPKVFSKLHPKHKTPYTALLLQVIIATVVTFTIPDFTVLAALVVLFTIIPYMFSSFATVRLINREKGRTHVLYHKAIAYIAGFASLALLGIYIEQPFVLVLGGILILAGIFVYLHIRRKHKIKKPSTKHMHPRNMVD